MRIETISIDRVQAAAYNPRTNLTPADAEYQALDRSMAQWSNVMPLVWNERTGNLVGGHQRFKILVAHGATDVDVSVVDLSDADERALNLALNKITGRWDSPKLFDVLSDLDSSQFDLTLTGFEPDVLQRLARELDKPLFAPLLQPTLMPMAPTPALTVATTQQVHAAEARQGEQFVAQEVRMITCPYCGEDFGVSKNNLPGGRSVREDDAAIGAVTEE